MLNESRSKYFTDDELTSSSCKQTETNKNLSENEKRNSCYTTHFSLLYFCFISVHFHFSLLSLLLFISIAYDELQCDPITFYCIQCYSCCCCVAQKTIELVNFSLVFRSNLLHIDHCIAFIVSAVLCCICHSDRIATH